MEKASIKKSDFNAEDLILLRKKGEEGLKAGEFEGDVY